MTHKTAGLHIFFYANEFKSFITVASLLSLIYLFHFKINKFTELGSEPELLKEHKGKQIIIWNMYRHCGFPLSNLHFLHSLRALYFRKINYTFLIKQFEWSYLISQLVSRKHQFQREILKE